jgi:ribosomal protein L27
LAAGEIGFESDTGKIKIGTGSTAWNALAYTASSTAVTYLFNATAAQTTFSGTDANGLTLAYTVGSEQVYLNGVLQVRGSDYTASNGTSIVLTSGALVSDVLNVIAFSALALADTYTQAQADAKFVQVANTPNPSNPVLNSAMQVWQRGTSFSVSAAVGYGADRWYYYVEPAGTISRQNTSDTTNLPNIQYCQRVQRNSGNTSTGRTAIAQSFESINSYPFIGKTVTLSFYARKGANFSGASSNLVVGAQTGTGTDQNIISGYTGSSNFINSTATLTTTWQRFTFTGTVSSSGTELGIYFEWNGVGTAGAADYFEITGVQIEVGSVVTPFRTNGATIQGELAACQRYYYRTGLDNFDRIGLGIGINGTTAGINISHPVQMRIQPSVLDYANLCVYDTLTITEATSVVIDNPSPLLTIVTATVASGLTQYRPYQLLNFNNPAGFIGFSAEL